MKTIKQLHDDYTKAYGSFDLNSPQEDQDKAVEAIARAAFALDAAFELDRAISLNNPRQDLLKKARKSVESLNANSSEVDIAEAIGCITRYYDERDN